MFRLLPVLLLALAASCAGRSVRRVDGDTSGSAGTPGDKPPGGAGSGMVGGATGASGGSPSSGLALEELPGALADAVCRNGDACGTDVYWQAWPGGCGALLTPLFRNTTAAQIGAGISAGTIVYDPVRVAACVATIRDLPCDAAWPRGFECPGGVDGTVPSGGSCSYDLECAGDAYCADACPGICVPRGRVGDVCGLGVQCTAGTHCLTSQLDGSRCSPLHGEGESCNGICRGALACELHQGAQNVCVARRFVGLGEPCDATFAICAGELVCAEALDAEPGQRICLPKVGSGVACRFATPSMCPDGEECSLPGGTAAEGTCMPTPGPGDACEPGTCRISLNCVAKRCRALFENGEACTSNAQCWSYRCLDEVCVVPACNEGEEFPDR
ncbi:MAG TPA: hypothetical protein VFV94_17855 [Polyangiaceae bacterium]|nr:hypothetical protein [Polyangiaceae bacterium]